MDPNIPGNSNAGALMIPASLPLQQPRQPHNLQGLLRFAMEATKAEDAPGNSDLTPMDEERRKFLEEALRGLTINIAEVIENALKVLTNTERMQSIKRGDELPEDVANAFSVLPVYIDDIDIANDFCKMGGFAIFPIAFSSENSQVHARASSILGDLCQNNPYCQAKALECGLLNVLLHMVRSEEREAKVKCIYAISCITREYAPACRELTEQDGCDTLATLLNSEPAARTKTAFLIRYLCKHCSDAKEEFIKLNIVGRVAEQLKKGRDQSTEHLLSILVAIIDVLDPVVVAHFRNPSIQLKKTLEDLLNHPSLADEEKEYCNELLSTTGLFSSNMVDPVEVADR